MKIKELLGISTEDYLERPWLIRQAAGIVEAPGDIKERAAILLKLSALPLKRQAVCLASCEKREELVKMLIGMEEYGSVICLLHSDLARWLPETGEFNDLVWLIENLILLKRQAAGKKARVVMQTKSGLLNTESAAMLEALVDEAVAAAAGAWVRCLNGPGGDHRVWELHGALEDPEIAENVLIILSSDPRALALLLEDDRPELSQIALELNEQIKYVKKGANAAAFCLKTITSRLKKMDGLADNGTLDA